jgi:hypothetical protein
MILYNYLKSIGSQFVILENYASILFDLSLFENIILQDDI